MEQDCTIRLGRIVSCEPGKAEVVYEQSSACSGCHAASACTIMDRKERRVTVYQDTSEFRVGDQVYLKAADSMGLKAVFWAFVMPLILLFIVAILVTQLFHIKDIWAVLYSLAAVAVYYLILSCFRKKLQKNVFFTIEKISNPQ